MTKNNINEFERLQGINNCPKCRSAKVTVHKKRVDSRTLSEITCLKCGHKLSGFNAQYTFRRWNTHKIELVEYTVDLLRKNPYTAYIGEYPVDTWGASKLCKYLGERLGVKVTIRRPVNFKGKGYILEAMYE